MRPNSRCLHFCCEIRKLDQGNYQGTPGHPKNAKRVTMQNLLRIFANFRGWSPDLTTGLLSTAKRDRRIGNQNIRNLLNSNFKVIQNSKNLFNTLFFKTDHHNKGRRKVYKQMHKTEEINYLWFLGGHFNIWFVNDEVGKAWGVYI